MKCSTRQKFIFFFVCFSFMCICIIYVGFVVYMTYIKDKSSYEQMRINDISGIEVINYNYPKVDTAVSVNRIRYDDDPEIRYHLPESDIAKQYHVGMFLLDGNFMNVLPWSNYLVDPSNNSMLQPPKPNYVPSYVDSVVLSAS